MRMSRLVAALVCAVALAGCAGSEDDGFAEGRQLGSVYQIVQDELGDDPNPERRAVFEQLHAVFTPDVPIEELGFDGVNDEHQPNFLVDHRNTREWAYSIPGFHDDQGCRECPPMTLSSHEMLEIAADLWDRLGVETSTPVFQRLYGEGDEIAGAIVLAYERRDGVVTGFEWDMRFGGDVDGVRSAGGYWGTTLVDVGQVPLLTVQEAYAQRGLPYLETDPDTVELGTNIVFDRTTGIYWQTPAWWIQPDALNAPIALDAYRHGDLASFKPVDQ